MGTLLKKVKMKMMSTDEDIDEILRRRLSWTSRYNSQEMIRTLGIPTVTCFFWKRVATCVAKCISFFTNRNHYSITALPKI